VAIQDGFCVEAVREAVDGVVALMAHGIAPADLPPLQEACEDRLRQAVTELGPESAATVLGSIFFKAREPG